jgi:hypothetical protein
VSAAFNGLVSHSTLAAFVANRCPVLLLLFYLWEFLPIVLVYTIYVITFFAIFSDPSFWSFLGMTFVIVFLGVFLLQAVPTVSMHTDNPSLSSLIPQIRNGWCGTTYRFGHLSDDSFADTGHRTPRPEAANIVRLSLRFHYPIYLLLVQCMKD